MKLTPSKALPLLVLLALVVRLVAAWVWQARLAGQFGFGDSLSYWQLGQHLGLGQPYRFGEQIGWIFRMPGYPALLAPIFWLAGPEASPLWGRALGAILGSLTVLGAWALARQLFGPRAGLIAAAMTAFYPGAIAASVLILSEAPFCPLMLANLLFWVWAEQSPGRGRAAGWALAAGVVAGLGTLVRPSWLLFLPFAAAVALVGWGGRKRRLALVAVMVLGLLVMMTPWWLRSLRLCGHFVPTTLQAGASLYDGWNPQATGASDMRFVGEFFGAYYRNPPQLPAEYPAAWEDYIDQRMGQAAVRWAKEHPGQVLSLAGTKFVRLWNLWPNEAALARWWIRLGVLITYLPLLLLGLVGAGLSIRRGFPYVLCWLPAVYFTLLHMIFVSSIRYREPAMLGLMVLAAGVVAGLGQAVTPGTGTPGTPTTEPEGTKQN